MWITRRELARLERELKLALRRAERAEDLLAAERQAKDWLTLQLTSRVVTKQGGYGLESEPPPKQIEPQGHPQGYTHEPTDIDLAKLEWYKQCAVNAGKPEEDAVEKWEAEMRGQVLIPDYVDDEAEDWAIG